MAMLARAVVKLPRWVQAALVAAAVPAFFYETLHYGFWSALIRFIFSPVI
jgi:hypothetical protein